MFYEPLSDSDLEAFREIPITFREILRLALETIKFVMRGEYDKPLDVYSNQERGL